jgi:hypothetical protein
MSMIGKLRQVSEFELAKFKKNPSAMVRALAGSNAAPLGGVDAQALMDIRARMQQSPLMQRMMELAKQGKAPSREEQAELRQQMMELMKQAQAGKQRAVAPPQPPADSATPSLVPAAELDLHKSWHCLHYLFTGKVEGSDGSALGDSIVGGTEIGGEAADTGYGPPRSLSPTQVRNVAAALEQFPIDQKLQLYDAGQADRAGIYCAQHDADELRDYFSQLREFYSDAAGKGNAVLLWIE